MESTNKEKMLKYAGIFIAIFLGAFLAFYLIFGNMATYRYSYNSSAMAEDIFKDQQKQFDELNKQFDHQFDLQVNQAFNPQFKTFPDDNHFVSSIIQLDNIKTSGVGIKTEDDKDFYKIIINLKPFNNDEKNVKVAVKNNRIDISAKYENKDKKSLNSAYAYQSITLPTKIDETKISQKRINDQLIIAIQKNTAPEKDKE